MSSIDKKKLPTPFRSFLVNKWMEHKDELFLWTNKFPEYDDKYYFRKHKWMLRKLFKEHMNGNNT